MSNKVDDPAVTASENRNKEIIWDIKYLINAFRNGCDKDKYYIELNDIMENIDDLNLTSINNNYYILKLAERDRQLACFKEATKQCNTEVDILKHDNKYLKGHVAYLKERIDPFKLCVRDHFAGLAMQGMVATSNNMNTIAQSAYDMADAMLEAREVGNE